MGRPKTGRGQALNFIPTTQQIRAIHALMDERRTDDPRVTQSDVIREVVQRGLEALRRPEVVEPR
jgi:hypothetical protein